MTLYINSKWYLYVSRTRFTAHLNNKFYGGGSIGFYSLITLGAAITSALLFDFLG